MEDDNNEGWYILTVLATLTNAKSETITSGSKSFNFEIKSSCYLVVFEEPKLDEV